MFEKNENKQKEIGVGPFKKSHFFECKFTKMIFCGHNQALPTINRFILIAIILNNKFSLRSSKIKKNIAKFERFAVSFFSA